MSGRSKTFSRAGIVFLAAAHLFVAVPLAYYLNIWSDEASTLYTTGKGLIEGISTAASVERQAPLYFWVMSLWRALGESIFVARIFSIICSIAAICLFGSIAGRLFGNRAAILGTALFALHPYLIWSSVEIRVYSLVILATLTLVHFFLASFWDESRNDKSVRAVAPFAVASTIALYTNYYTGFLLVGLFVGLLITGKTSASKRYLLTMLVVLVAISPLLIIASGQFALNSSDYRVPVSMVDGVRLIWHHVVVFLLPTEVFNDEISTAIDIARAWIVRMVLIAVALLAVFRRDAISKPTALLFGVNATIAAFLFMAYMVLGSDYIELRHAAVLFAPLLLAFVSFVTDLAPRKESVPAAIATGLGTAVVLGSFTLGLFSLFPKMAKRGDWARVGEFISRNETRDQPIATFPIYDSLTLPYHYRGINRVIPHVRQFDFHRPTASSNSAEGRLGETDFLISQIPPDADQIWLATSAICSTSKACGPLENYVAENYTVVLEENFYHERLRLLIRK